MNSQNQNQNQDRAQGQNQNARPEDTKKAQGQQQEMTEEDQKDVKGGSGLLSGGNDLTNLVGGNVGISNSSNGTNGDDSYSSNDSHNVDLGLGNVLGNTNY